MPAPQDKTDAIVVGAGLAGLVATAELADAGKRVVVLDQDGFYDGLWAFLDSLRERGFVRDAALQRLHRVHSVDEAFTLLASLL